MAYGYCRVSTQMQDSDRNSLECMRLLLMAGCLTNPRGGLRGFSRSDILW